MQAITRPDRTEPVAAMTVHPVWLRVTHWLNALAVVVMVTSGWRIYNAAPSSDSEFPPKSPWAAGWAARCSGISPPCGCWSPTACCTW